MEYVGSSIAVDVLQANYNAPLKSIDEECRRRHGFSLSKSSLSVAKEKGLEVINGQPGESFGLVTSLVDVLRNEWKVTASYSVKRRKRAGKFMFHDLTFTFPSTKMFLQYGSKVFVADACHSKSIYGGVILSIVTLDAERKVVPLAVHITSDNETNEAWAKLFGALQEEAALHGIDIYDPSFTVVGDRKVKIPDQNDKRILYLASASKHQANCKQDRHS